MYTEDDFRFSFEHLASADFTPQVVEFFSRAYLSGEIAGNFRILPGVKNKVQLAATNFQSVLKAPGCSFENTAVSATATVTIDVRGAAALFEICQYDLEQMFVAHEMPQGANASYTNIRFLQYFWNEAASKISEEMTQIRWKGNVTGTGPDYSGANEFMKRADGYLKRLDAAVTGVTATTNGAGTMATLEVVVNNDGAITAVNVTDGGAYTTAPTQIILANTGEGTDAAFTIATSGVSPNIVVDSVTVTDGGFGYPQKVIAVTGTTLTEANVLTEFKKAFLAIPASVRRQKDKLRIYVSPVTADMYLLKVSEQNNMAYITKALDLTYLGIKIVVEDGMEDDTIVICRGESNLVYAFDGEGDEKQLKLVDLSTSIAERKLRARVDLKMGFYTLNNAEIVYYRIP